MSEYIITEKQLKTATEAFSEREVPLPITNVFISGDKLPEIVRCRDCYYLTDSPAWPGAYECDFINRGVESDGFCAWACRKEQ